MDNIIAIIPARAGSVRVKNKNTRPFYNGKSLLEICIEKLIKLPVDRVVVNSESDEILEMAWKAGASKQKRPFELAESTTNPNDLAEYIARQNASDYILYVHCTSPFLKQETIERFLKEGIIKLRKHDSVNSASLIKKHLWMAGSPLNYEKEFRPNTQMLPDIYALNYGLNLIKREKMIKYRDFIGVNPFLFEIPDSESIDIDTEDDWKLAESLYGKI